MGKGQTGKHTMQMGLLQAAGVPKAASPGLQGVWESAEDALTAMCRMKDAAAAPGGQGDSAVRMPTWRVMHLS